MDRTSKFNLSFAVLGRDYVSRAVLAVYDNWTYSKAVCRSRKHIGIITASKPSRKPRMLVMLQVIPR